MMILKYTLTPLLFLRTIFDLIIYIYYLKFTLYHLYQQVEEE